MKVAFITGGFPSKENPMHGIFNYRAVKGLQQLVDVEVIRVRMWRPFKKFINIYDFENIKVYELFLPLPPYTKHSIKLQILIMMYVGWSLIGNILKRFDLFHSVGVSVSGIVAAFWAQKAKKHHVTQVIGSDLIFQFPRVKSSLLSKNWAKWVHGVSCNTLFLRNLFKKYFPEIPNIEVIYRGTDLLVFNPQGDKIQGIASLNGTKFLYIGGFPFYPDIPYGDNLKGGRSLLKAWEIVDRSVTKASPIILIIGGPSTHKIWLKKWQKSLRFPEKVKIIGKVEPKSMPKLYRSVDVLLLPSFSEGMPNAAVEASASGIPVFASYVDGIPELVVNEHNGLLLPPGKPEVWAEAIMQYYDKTDKLRLMGKNGRLIAETKFDSKKFPVKMFNLYKKALGVGI